ncbi:MAG TPA: insulinase family protein [Vicinamibacterales bacterium]
MNATRAIAAAGLMVLCFSGLAQAQTAGRVWPTERPPQPLAARDIKFPPYEIQTLPNGLQVVVVMHHEQPSVSMRLLVRVGTANDPKDQMGIAHLAASLLDQGTTSRSAQEMNDDVDFIGGVMGAGAGSDLTFVQMIVMKDSFEKGMRMLSDMARHPGFAPDEIDRQRQQTLSGLTVSLEDPEYIANSVFDRLVYGFHPYGMPDTGTPESLARLTRADLVAFHSRYFIPNNAILAIVGDVTAEESFAAAKKIFGDWEKRDLVPDKFIAPPEPIRRVVVVNKPDAVQTEIRVGHIGIPRTHPDYMAVNLAIRILGGEGSNRLHQVLRTERGLTYGAQANMDTLKEAGDFEAETNTRSEATGEVLRLIVDEFWRLQRERVGEGELSSAKAYLTGSFPLTIETPGAIAMQVVNALFYGLPLEQLQNFRERVNAVTVDDVQRVAKTLLRPDRLSVVLVGNAAAFTPQLRGVGFATFETVELGDLDLMAANFKRVGRAAARLAVPPAAVMQRTALRYRQTPAATRPPAVPKPEDAQKAVALLDRAIAAKGGLAALRGLHTIIAKQTLSSPSDPGAPKFTVTTYIQYPDRLRIETVIPGGLNILGYDGKEAWVKNEQGVHAQPSVVASQARLGMRRDVVSLLLAAKDGAVTARLLPDVSSNVAGSSAPHVDHVLELTAPDLNPILIYIDPESSLITKETYVDDAPGRPSVEERFSDYRLVNGYQIAFKATRRIGMQIVDRLVSDVKVNPNIDQALFLRPAS